jgi:Ca2+:H+ antiporter
LQRSLNAALGSALATIGLTFPVVGLVSLFTGQSIVIGLEKSDAVLLILALGINVVGFATGHTTILTGLVHLVVFATFVFLIFVP